LGKAGLINIEREANLSGRFHDRACTSLPVICEASSRKTSRFHWPPASASNNRIPAWMRQCQFDGDLCAGVRVVWIAAAAGHRRDWFHQSTGRYSGHRRRQRKDRRIYDVCRIKGLTGTQGVMMPESNVEDLMLREDVLEAVGAGKFHIWPVAKVEQGIEILTGSTAGKKKGRRQVRTGNRLRAHGRAHEPNGPHVERVRIASKELRRPAASLAVAASHPRSELSAAFSYAKFPRTGNGGVRIPPWGYNPKLRSSGSPRHSALVRVTHWIHTFSFIALALSGIAILLAHPRLYWGETGAVGTPSLIDLPFPFVLELQIRGPGRYLHFLSAWICVLTGLLYVLSGLFTRHFWKNLVPSKTDLGWKSIRRVVSNHMH